MTADVLSGSLAAPAAARPAQLRVGVQGVQSCTDVGQQPGQLLPDISMVSSKLGCRGARSGWIMSAFPIYAGRRQSCNIRVLHPQLPHLRVGTADLTNSHPSTQPHPAWLHPAPQHSAGTHTLGISHSHHPGASCRAMKPLGKAAAFGAKPGGSNVPCVSCLPAPPPPPAGA